MSSRRIVLWVAAALCAGEAAASAQVIVVSPRPYFAPMPFMVRTRIRWRYRRVVVTPPPVYVEAPPVYAAPPVYLAPPPVYAAAPPAYAQPAESPAPDCLVASAPVPPPPWTSRIGLGFRGTGLIVDPTWHVGMGGEFLYRATAHIVTELGAEYLWNTEGYFDRSDVPVTFGVRIHIGRPSWVVSPYFVAAAGADIAWQDLKRARDTAYYFDGQLGGGVELRLGQRVAITADARFDGRKRLNDPSAAVVALATVDGKPVRPLHDEYGAQLRLGLAVYF